MLFLPAVLSVVSGLFSRDLSFASAICSVSSFALFIVFLALFGIDVERKIADRVTRSCIIHIDILFTFWILIRTIKFEAVTSKVLERNLWYWYYLPIVFSAFFFFWVVDNLCHDDELLKKKHLFMLGGLAFLLVAFVVTNDFHGLVFDVQTEAHRFGYYVVAGYLIVTMISSLVRLFTYNGGVTAIKRMLPSVLALLCILGYCILYVVPEVSQYIRIVDFTTVYIVFSVAFLEGLIDCRAIPSNSDYKWCFLHSTVNAQIVDRHGNVKYRSLDARPVVATEFEMLSYEAPLRVSSDIELVTVPISGGSVIWERNIRDINRLMKILTETQESIKEANDSLRKSIDIEKRQKKTMEQNRLYDITFSKVADSVSKLEKSIDRASNLSGELLRRELRKIDVLGVYVKRKSNLLLLSQAGLSDFSGELKLCFKETFDNLKDGGICAQFSFLELPMVSLDEAMVLYELLESVLEVSLYNLCSCHAIVSMRERLVLTVNLTFEDEAPYETFCKELVLPRNVFLNIEHEEAEITISFKLPKREVEE